MLFKTAKKLAQRCTNWQRWPFLLFYAPISFAWVWNYIKSRSFWYFTAANPTLAFGGFEGETKSEMYQQLPPHLCPRSIFIKPGTPFNQVLQMVEQSGLQYPFIVKPDAGMKGILFRKIERQEQLQKYHSHMPADYIIQEYLDLPLEVSVFYYRRPGSAKGIITAMIQKDLLEVTGDGKHTVLELVDQKAETKTLLPKIKKEYGRAVHEVLPKGEIFRLSHIANLANGARFINLKEKITSQLVTVFDNISLANQFYYGRYDIKCASVNDLEKGAGFYLLEFNGSGSTPNHIYTGTYTLLQAYKEVMRHWKLLYEASYLNNQQGHRYWDFKKGLRFMQSSKKHFDTLKKIDKELVL